MALLAALIAITALAASPRLNPDRSQEVNDSKYPMRMLQNKSGDRQHLKCPHKQIGLLD